MKIPRRTFLHVAAGAAALPAVSRFGFAQAYPSRPVRVIVGQAAGSGSDTAARLIGQFLSERLGQQFVIENRPGAAGNLATEAVVRAPPDGYTLLLANGANTINATLYDRLHFDFIRDIAPINRLATFSFVMEVNPSVPSLLEFITYAKANPGKINMASAGSGSTSHVTGELFKIMAGVEMVHVPYRGSTPALTDLLGGQVQVMFDATPSSLPHIRAGKLRPLAVTTATRLEALPDVPTVGDFVPGYEASSWLGFGAPKNTPAAVMICSARKSIWPFPTPPSKHASSILGDRCCLRVRPLSLKRFWPAIPKSGRGSFGRRTSNQSRTRSLTFHNAPFGEKVGSSHVATGIIGLNLRPLSGRSGRAPVARLVLLWRC
jgi:tripartite-type tricarboxylate transporter receptor subunit TctC